MYQSIKEFLAHWDTQTTDRQKMQHAYITLALVLIVAAGVFGLLNQSLGQQIIAVAIASAAIFLVNAIAWALLQSFILMNLVQKADSTTTLKQTPKKRKK